MAGTLTGLLGERGGLALAILRHSDHADVVVDARFQSVDCIMTSGWQDKLFRDGDALASGNHYDLVTSNGCGVEW